MDSGRLADAMEALSGSRIRHTVSFTLPYADGSAEETDFLASAAELGAIPGVEAFEILREVSPKNGYRFGISDQAFYIPAIALSRSPDLFPRDRVLIAPQARLTDSSSLRRVTM